MQYKKDGYQSLNSMDPIIWKNGQRIVSWYQRDHIYPIHLIGVKVLDRKKNIEEMQG